MKHKKVDIVFILIVGFMLAIFANFTYMGVNAIKTNSFLHRMSTATTKIIYQVNPNISKPQERIFYSKEFNFTDKDDQNPFVYETAAMQYIPEQVYSAMTFTDGKKHDRSVARYVIIEAEKHNYLAKIQKIKNRGWYIMSIQPIKDIDSVIKQYNLKEESNGEI